MASAGALTSRPTTARVLVFKWQPNFATTQMSTSSLRRWCEHFPTPPFSRAIDFFRSSAVALVPLSSRIKPLLEVRLEALEHLFFNVFDVGEPVPTSDIAVFTVTLKLQNEFFH
jgi:hypothetical protein